MEYEICEIRMNRYQGDVNLNVLYVALKLQSQNNIE